MAGSKKKRVIQKEMPQDHYVTQMQDPDSYYKEHPAWSFKSCDAERWQFTSENIGDAVWTEILPYLQNLETQTWKDVLLAAKKQNHSIDVRKLNVVAQRRLTELYIEQDAIISLRLSATHRLYGYIIGRVFNILWYDNNHGDNDACVCRAKQKHT